MPTYEAITVLGVNCLTTDVTVTASVVNTTKTALDSKALPSEVLGSLGRNLHIRARGLITTSAVPVTYNVFVDYGTTRVCSTGVFTPTAAMTNSNWELECDVTTTVVGTAAGGGTVEGQGIFRYYPTASTIAVQTLTNGGAVSMTNTGIVTPRLAIQYGGNTLGNSINIRTDVWEVGGLV